mgnify:CR=1 FL=1
MPELAVLPCNEIWTLSDSGEAQDGNLMGADWNDPDGYRLELQDVSRFSIW